MIRLVFNVHRDGKSHLMSAVVHGDLDIQPFEKGGPQDLADCQIGAFMSAELSYEQDGRPAVYKWDQGTGEWQLSSMTFR